MSRAIYWLFAAIEHARHAVSERTHALIRVAIAKLQALLAIQKAAAR
ncbi:MAG TPA: hypothetical protein VGE96_00955 [Steroidobacteraceae bacterium]|jgi:hypothetical protein